MLFWNEMFELPFSGVVVGDMTGSANDGYANTRLDTPYTRGRFLSSEITTCREGLFRYGRSN